MKATTRPSEKLAQTDAQMAQQPPVSVVGLAGNHGCC